MHSLSHLVIAFVVSIVFASRAGIAADAGGQAAEGGGTDGSRAAPGDRPASAPRSPLGIGEPRVPSPFTPEQRYLEAARQGDRVALGRSLAKGVPVDTKDDLGRSAFLLVVRDAGNIDLMRLLRARGAAIDSADAGGRTPLSWAATAGRLDIVRELVTLGAVVDRRDAHARTPLFHAVTEDRRDVVAFLLGHGANIDAADRFGDTPLIMACSKGFGELANQLLAAGADAKIRDQEGRSVADRAAAGAEACKATPDGR
jgi:ankyrin repeat protein